MSGTHLGNTQPTIDQEEHRSVNGVNAKAVVPYLWDGSNLVPEGSSYAMQSVVDGAITYLAQAVPGSLTASSVWRAMKIDETSGAAVITWADGNANFDNVATNLASLSYS